MSCVSNNNFAISFVIGDTLNKVFEITGERSKYIKEVYFICKDFNIEKKLFQDRLQSENEYILEISSEETKTFPAQKITDYDIKIIFVDEKIYTASYRSSFVGLTNKNSFNEEV